MMEIRVRCKKTIIEDENTLFIEGKTYEAYKNPNETIDGRSEIDQYVTVSTSGNFIFEDYFEVILDEITIQEIVEVSNHTRESMLESFDFGVIEIYPNKQSYIDAGWNFENEDHFSILSDGRVVYFE